MATRPLPGFENWFHDFQFVEDRSLPRLWWPSLMSETRRPSLLQRHVRLTLGFWHWRWSWILVEQKPEPDMEFNAPELGVSEWIRWSTNWSKGRLSSQDINNLIRQKDQPWGRLVRLGAANYHYGRLVLAREALAQSRSRAKQSSSATNRSANSGPSGRSGVEMNLDMPDLSLPTSTQPPHDQSKV